jgi:hypothetical protein
MESPYCFSWSAHGTNFSLTWKHKKTREVNNNVIFGWRPYHPDGIHALRRGYSHGREGEGASPHLERIMEKKS